MFNSTTSDVLMFVAFFTGGAIGWVYFDVIRDKIVKLFYREKKDEKSG